MERLWCYRSDMDETVPVNPNSLSVVCEEAVAAYRGHGKSIQVLAIRKVLESVIRQKSEHISALRAFDGLPAAEAQRIDISGSYPADVLGGLVTHEKAFAATLDALASSLSDEEARQNVKAMADAGRKFASWAQDHLDLIAMF